MTMVDAPPETLAEFASMLTGAQRKKGEKVIYYRLPQKDIHGKLREQAGWIIWADSQLQKQINYLLWGWTPLPQFGQVQKFFKDDERAQNTPDKYGPWGPILSHPEGPKQFPVDQVLTYRWYDPEQCPVPGVHFPQLARWLKEGGEIVEYACPDCTSRNFLDPLHLARHCRNAHNYNPQEIVTLGQSIGVDFSRVFKRMVKKIAYDTPAEQAHAEMAQEVLAPLAAVAPVKRVQPEKPQVRKAKRAKMSAEHRAKLSAAATQQHAMRKAAQAVAAANSAEA